MQFTDKGKVKIRFFKSDTLPTEGELKLNNASDKKDGGYTIHQEKTSFNFVNDDKTTTGIKYDSINLGEVPTKEDMDAKKGVEANTSMKPDDFIRSEQLKALIANSTHLKGKSGDIGGWGVKFESGAADQSFKIVKKDAAGGVDEELISGTFVGTAGGGRRRGSKRVSTALACTAVAARRKLKLKPVGKEVTRDGKERAVYLMGRARVVRMRPPGSARTEVVRVSDITKTGVRGWSARKSVS